MEHARSFLVKEMGLDLKKESQNVPINFTKDEVNEFVRKFREIDDEKKGYITINDLRRHFKVSFNSVGIDNSTCIGSG